MDITDQDDGFEVQHDLHFTDACKFGDYISDKKIEHQSLRPVWRAFQESVERIRVMAVLPQAIAAAAVDCLLPISQAVFNVSGKPVLDDDELEPTRRAISDEYNRIRMGFLRDRPKVQEALNRELVVYNKYNLVDSPLARPGYIAILEAQIIGTWTAFDVLTTDLCVAVVNSMPSILYNIGQRQITLQNLLDAGEDRDWNGRMGELARQFVRFDSFKNTKDAYRLLFKDDDVNQAIDSPVTSLACLIRTQLTHDAGIATPKFIDQARSMNADPWQHAEISKRLPIDGRNAAGVSEGVVQCANNLVLAVDAWMKRRAPRVSKSQDQVQ